MNLLPSLRERALWNSYITERLGTYSGEPSIHTRRPVPAGATYPALCFSPQVSKTDQDFLVPQMPVVRYDATTYGEGGPPGSATDQYRVVEEIAFEVHDMFHRRGIDLVLDEALLSQGFRVVDIVANGPIPAPTDSERLIGRAVMLTIRLHRNP